MSATNTEPRTYWIESLAGLTGVGIAVLLSKREADGWRLAAILPYRPGNVGDIAVVEPWALLYRLPSGNGWQPSADDAATCLCPACGTAHRSKGG